MNFVSITGEIIETPVQAIESGNKRFFKTTILVYRKKWKFDVIPLIIPEREKGNAVGFISATGAFRSYKIGNMRKSIVCIDTIRSHYFRSEDTNLVFLNGTLKKKTDDGEGIIFCHNKSGSYETIPIMTRKYAKELWKIPIDSEVMVVGRLKSFVTTNSSGSDIGCKLLVSRIDHAVKCRS